MGVPQNGSFIRENPTKMDELGVPRHDETETAICWWTYVQGEAADISIA